MNRLAFPIIAVSEHGGIDLHYTPEELTQSYAKRVRRGWYRNMVLLGSNGMKCAVTSVVVLGGLGPWFGFSLLYSRRVRVRLELEPPIMASLEDSKSLLLEAVRKEPHLWNSSVDVSLRTWKRRIQEAPSFAALVQVIEEALGFERAA